jgi:hypothetical protein
MKEDECGKTENKGEKIDEEDGTFRFKGEDKGERVWMVLGLSRMFISIGSRSKFKYWRSIGSVSFNHTVHADMYSHAPTNTTHNSTSISTFESLSRQILEIDKVTTGAALSAGSKSLSR